MKKLNITKEQFEKSRYFKNKYGKLEYVSESGKVFKTDKGKVLMFKESDKKFGRKFKESYTDMSAIEEKLASAFDAEIRSMTPDDIQGVYESAKDDEMAVSTIFVLLQQAFASRKFTDEERKKLLNADPKLISGMVLDMINHLLPQSKGYQILALGMARAAVKEMTDQDWKDIVEYALNNPDNL